MTADTLSIEAYRECAPKRMVQREIVLDVIARARHPSSADIERFTHIPRTSVTGRLKELEQEGLIRKAGKKIDPWTKHKVYWYAVIEQGAGQ